MNEPTIVSAVAVIRQGAVLILRRGPTAPWMPGYWNLPGGEADGERPAVAAIRECVEEAGIHPDNLRFHKAYRRPEYTLHVYVGETEQAVPTLDYESDRWAWVTKEEVPYFSFVPDIKEAILELLEQC